MERFKDTCSDGMIQDFFESIYCLLYVLKVQFQLIKFPYHITSTVCCRLFADILNDMAIFMEILAPSFPWMFTPIVCTAGVCKVSVVILQVMLLFTACFYVY